MKGLIFFILFSVMVNSQAGVVNSLGGVNYEWLELTNVNTQGKSRNDVESWLAAQSIGSTYYGYQYASRLQVEQLFQLYFDYGNLINGFYTTNNAFIQANINFFNDFGVTEEKVIGLATAISRDAGYFSIDGFTTAEGYYGLKGECGGLELTCRGVVQTRNFNGNPVAVLYAPVYGYDSTATLFTLGTDRAFGRFSSFLLRTDTPPTSASVSDASTLYLFIFGLLGLLSLSGKKVLF